MYESALPLPVYLSFTQLSYADVTFFDVFNSFMANGKQEVPDQLKPFPLLVEHYNRVMNIPEIKAWIEKRPKTDIWAKQADYELTQ